MMECPWVTHLHPRPGRGGLKTLGILLLHGAPVPGGLSVDLLEGVTAGRLVGTIPKEGPGEAPILFSIIVCQVWYILCI